MNPKTSLSTIRLMFQFVFLQLQMDNSHFLINVLKVSLEKLHSNSHEHTVALTIDL